MKTGRKISCYLSTTLSLVIFFTSNYCAFEYFFFYTTAHVTDVTLPTHLDKHIGATIPHTHTENDSHGQEDNHSHTHSEPQAVSILSLDKLESLFSHMQVCLVNIIQYAVYAILHAFLFWLSLFVCQRALQIDYVFGLRRLVSNLTLAPQAPPAYCF